MPDQTKSQFSISLGRFFGIPTSIHWTFWILILWIIYTSVKSGKDFYETSWYILFIFVIFACVVLHELGHALMARQFGIATRSITILPIGGLASLESIPESPVQELKVAIAGPAVNVVIAAFLALVLFISGNLFGGELELVLENINGSNFLIAIFFINVTLVVFNLIPAFPMDGGRVLRAFLAMKMNRLKATETAVWVGKFFAILFIFIGFSGNPFLVFIGFFIIIAANQELSFTRTTSFISSYKVSDILMHHYQSLSPQDSLSDAIKLLLDGQDEHFPILDEGDFKGILTKENIILGLQKYGEHSPIKNSMNKTIHWLNTDTSLKEVYGLITTKGLSTFPVRQDDRFVGIVDVKNLNEFLLLEQAKIKQRK